MTMTKTIPDSERLKPGRHAATSNQQRASTRLRQMLAQGKTLYIPGCYNAMTARVLEAAGFPLIYMTGYGTSLSLTGLPDAGLTTMSEMVLNARYIAAAVKAPLIADADSGFGNAVNVIRTVREYIAAGVAGIHIEDQVSPKRCGHVAGRTVVSLQEAVGRYRAADAARRELDPDFVLIARTDARGAHGGTLEDAIERSNAYLQAGADMAFLEGPANVEEVRTMCREIDGPILYNMTGISPRFSLPELQDLGIAVAITAGTLMRVTLQATYDMAVALREQGPAAEVEFMNKFKTHPLGDLHTFAGFDQIRAWEEAYLPEDDLQKYSQSLGHMPAGRG